MVVTQHNTQDSHGDSCVPRLKRTRGPHPSPVDGGQEGTRSQIWATGRTPGELKLGHAAWDPGRAGRGSCPSGPCAPGHLPGATTQSRGKPWAAGAPATSGGTRLQTGPTQEDMRRTRITVVIGLSESTKNVDVSSSLLKSYQKWLTGSSLLKKLTACWKKRSEVRAANAPLSRGPPWAAAPTATRGGSLHPHCPGGKGSGFNPGGNNSAGFWAGSPQLRCRASGPRSEVSVTLGGPPRGRPGAASCVQVSCSAT